MFWNDIKEMRNRLTLLEARTGHDTLLLQNIYQMLVKRDEVDEVLGSVGGNVLEILRMLEEIQERMPIDNKVTHIGESIEGMTAEMSRFREMLSDSVQLTMDNSKRLNTMINEMKGAVAMVRSVFIEASEWKDMKCKVDAMYEDYWKVSKVKKSKEIENLNRT